MNLLSRFFRFPDEVAMKIVAYRGGVVKFRIPAHWQEQYSNEGGLFYADRPGSGSLRLKITTMLNPKQPPRISGADVLQMIQTQLIRNNVKGTTKDRKDGSAVLKYAEATSEQGKSLTIFYWVMATSLPPRHTRIATFSYTIPSEQRKQRRIQRELEMLESEIEAAIFSEGD